MSSRQRTGLIGAAAVFGLWYWLAPGTQHASNGAPGVFTRRIVAVGDLHSDFGNAYKVLRMANVVDKNGRWSGEVDYFVQTGDIVDRCVPVPDRTPSMA
jgi:hypothetical protein